MGIGLALQCRKTKIYQLLCLFFHELVDFFAVVLMHVSNCRASWEAGRRRRVEPGLGGSRDDQLFLERRQTCSDVRVASGPFDYAAFERTNWERVIYDALLLHGAIK